MKEVWFFKNGVGYIEYIDDISDIHLDENSYINENSTNTNTLSEEEDSYYENLFNQYENQSIFYEKEKTNTVVKKIDALLKFNNSNYNNWEKSFIYGLKRLTKFNKVLTPQQIISLDKMVIKYVPGVLH